MRFYLQRAYVFCSVLLKRERQVLATALFSGFMSLPVNGQENQQIVVTATRTAQIADQSLAPTIVIDKEDIELSQATDIGDLLRFHAGMELSRNGGPGQNTSLFIRGTESDHVIVLIDGVKMNPRTVSLPALQHINPEMIERIEIVKGPRSALYGSEGIGGVINIITKRKKEPGTDIHLGAGAGDNYTNLYQADVHHTGGIIRTGVSFQRYNTDGFPIRTDSDLDRGYLNISSNAYLSAHFGSTSFELSNWRTYGNVEYLGFSYDALDQDFKNQVSSLTVKTSLGSTISAISKISRAIDKLTQNQSDGLAETERDTIDLQLDWELNSFNLLSAGLYSSNENIASISFSVPTEAKDVNTHAFFIQNDFEFRNHHLVAAARYSDFERYGNEITYNADYGFKLNPQTSVTLGIGKGFRTPSFFDRFGFGGNQDLDPETSVNYEFGLRHKINKNNSTSLNIFHNEIDNLINWNSLSGLMENIDETRIRGVEFGYLHNSEKLTYRMEITLQDPEDRIKHEQLLRRATQKFTTGLRYRYDSNVIGVDFLASNDRTDFGDVTLPGYGVINLNHKSTVNGHWTILSRIENLFNKQYELASGYNTQDRFFLIETRYSN